MATVTGLDEGLTYYFIATAYTADGVESLPSNEVAYTAPGAPPVTISVSLAWDPSPDSNVAGYAIHYGNGSGNYSTSLDVGNQTTATVAGLARELTYYFVVTAYTADGVESLPSNEVKYPDEAAYTALGGLQVTLLAGSSLAKIGFAGQADETVSVQASEDLVSWTTLYELHLTSNQPIQIVDPDSANLPQRFYRLMGANVAGRTLQFSGLSAAKLAKVSFVAPAGNAVQVQASEDLVNWTTLYRLNITTNQQIKIVDAASAYLPQRFYRIVPAD
jgi:hypothetical protein